MSEVKEVSKTLEKLPTPPALETIRQRAIDDLRKAVARGEVLSAEDRITRDVFGFATDNLRSAEMAPKEAFNKTVVLTQVLKVWLAERLQFDQHPYFLEKDPIGKPGEKISPQERDLEFTVTGDDFDLNFTYFRNRDFSLQIDFMDNIDGKRPQYRSGKKLMTENLTSEEAQVISFYAELFLSSQKPPIHKAA